VRKFQTWTVTFIIGLALALNGLLIMAISDPVILPLAGSTMKLWMLIAGSQLFLVGFVIVLYCLLTAKSWTRPKKVSLAALLFLLLLLVPAIVYSI